MREDRQGRGQSAIDQHLLGGVRNVIGAADDVGDAHFDVIDDSSQVVGGQGTVRGVGLGGAQEDEILDLLVSDFRGPKTASFESRDFARAAHENEPRAAVPWRQAGLPGTHNA